MKTENLLHRPGATLCPDGTVFTVYSRDAHAVDVCLYDAQEPGREVARARMRRGESGWWQVMVPQVGAGMLYGFRAHGERHPERGFRFDGKKLLLDPYARAIHGKPDAADHMLSGPRSRDNGSAALKSVIVDESFDWAGDVPPAHAWEDTVICELHVKGFTKRHPELAEELRGTYAGLAHPAVTSYLRSVGITVVQLLPVHTHLHDDFLLKRGLTNYWGYQTIGFFAPHGEYASCVDPQEQVREFKRMVRDLHVAGIEVILDVVYNHTAEGGPGGPMVMLRGLDDAAYYRQDADHNYVDVTGCGNSVDSTSEAGLRLILDSLRYWVTEMHVDGFRFDLAVTLGRDEHDAFSQHSPFFAAVRQDPVLSRVKLIAEPWDLSRADSYQVGGFPAPWRELNGRFRDTVRCFWRGDGGLTPLFAKRFCGSEDIYGPQGRSPLSSVNFMTSHDGFTLADLVSYEKKHNLNNGEENRDGDDHNFSSNGGAEGVTLDEQVLARRSRLSRSLMATLILSAGVPMICAGDERGRTQRGNNNAYCQDNDLSWLDWSMCDEELLRLTRRVIHLRRERAALRRKDFFNGLENPLTGLRDVTWLEGDGSWLCREEWHDSCRQHFGALIDGGVEEPALLLLFNPGIEDFDFKLPDEAGTSWRVLFDTAKMECGTEYAAQSSYPLGWGSLACLEAVTEESAG